MQIAIYVGIVVVFLVAVYASYVRRYQRSVRESEDGTLDARVKRDVEKRDQLFEERVRRAEARLARRERKGR